MKNGLVWNKQHEGLNFVIENQIEFKEIFRDSKVRIFSYTN